MQDLNLGVIGNSAFAAVIDRWARIVWACYPRLDGDPVFCSLVNGADAGFFAVDVQGAARSEQAYDRNTAVLATMIEDAHGNRMHVTDFSPRFKQFDRIFRPPMVVRVLEPVLGACRVRLRLRPVFEDGAVRATVTLGSNHLRYVGPRQALRLTTEVPVSYIAEERPFVLDRRLSLILGPDETLFRPIAETVAQFLEQTRDYWREWVRYLSVPFEWQEAVIRAAITLKLCSFEETGAIVAALTTSIPEAPGSGRNWDYRYCWLRDAYFVVQALNRLGATRTMEDFIRFVTNVADVEPGERLRPVYPIVPGARLPEREAAALAGYRGMGPVRLGNAAEDQVQNDSYGNVVLAAAQMFFDRRLPRQGDAALFTRLETLGERAVACALEPDAGLWEYRTRCRAHTHSAVMCWAACDRLAKIAEVLGLPERATRWRAEASRLHETISARAWDPTERSFVDGLDGGHVDASVLLLPEIGFIAPTDPRFIASVDAVTRHLRRGDHLLRYAAADDFGVPETSFIVCTLWYVDALAAIGRRGEARAIFEGVLAGRNHLGLMSEDIAPESGELWGNFPQSYILVGLINSAMRVSRSWEEAFWRGW
ncbi:MAG: glycoside hydrolase family 15 protein [Alphaproteobacteria bacterium]